MYESDSNYLITEEGFAYDTQRGMMLKGSTVSGHGHQLADVETLKTQLLNSGALYEAGDRYVCAEDIKTGLLMAYNLHSDSLVWELPEWEVYFAPDSDDKISVDEALELWAVYSPDPVYTRALEKDSYRVTKLIRADYDWTFVNGKGDGSLSKVEQFVIDALIASGEIDEWRRGDPDLRECDIVDEKRLRQIEFVSLFDEKVPPRYRYRNEINEEQALVLEYYDFGYNIVADGVVNKFTKKNYTDNYSKELAIYMVGSPEEAADKVEALSSILAARSVEIRNYYSRIHVIMHDPLDTETFVYCSNDKYESYPDSLCSVNIVERTEADPDRIDPDKSYLLIRQNIFVPGLRSMLWAKGEVIRQTLDTSIE